MNDVRYALRMLRRTPGATAVALVSLAIGMAVNTTVFSWVRGILLTPVPGVEAPERLVTIETVAPSGTLIDSSYPDYRAVRDEATLLSGVVIFKERPLGLGAEPHAERAWALTVSGNYFDALGVRPALGRFFRGAEQDDVPDAHPVAVLSDAAWRSRFGADRSVVGRTITLNRQPYTVIGVAPPGFFGTIGGLRFDLFVPITMQASLTGGSPITARTSRGSYLMARLRPGATVDTARAEVQAIAARLARTYPATNAQLSFTILPLTEARRGAGRELGPMLRVLAAAGALVLLIVCANVANLQFARAAARRHEVGVKTALGAGRGRLIRQWLTEGLVVGVLGGALGLVASAWLVDVLPRLLPFAEYPLVVATPVGWHELAFTAAAVVVASLLFSLVPALQASAATARDSAASARGRVGDPHATRIGQLLVVAQVALAMTALVGAALLVRSFDNARRANPGFDRDHVLLAGISLSTGGYDRDRGREYLSRAVDRVVALPGVAAVAVAEDAPLGLNGGSWEDLTVDGYVSAPGENMKIDRNLVSPGYFQVMGIPIVAGRDIGEGDRRGRPNVAVVNRTFAERFFGGRDPLGRTVHGWGVPIEVVGVVADSKYHDLTEAPRPYLYAALDQRFGASTGVGLHVRTAGDPAALTPSVREALQELDPQLPPPLMTTLAAYTANAYARQALAATFVGALAILALALSAVGLYSLLAYTVARRRRELGVRIALGADVTGLVLADGLRLAAIGIGVGAALALGLARALGALLFGVSPLDPGSLAAAGALVAGLAALASYLPARAAARVDPMEAMRAE